MSSRLAGRHGRGGRVLERTLAEGHATRPPGRVLRGLDFRCSLQMPSGCPPKPSMCPESFQSPWAPTSALSS